MMIPSLPCHQVLRVLGRPLLLSRPVNFEPDVIIVPGTLIFGTSGPSLGMVKRVSRAVELLRSTNAKKLVLVGGVDGDLAEPVVMKDVALRNGLTEENIITIVSASSTFGNAQECKKLCENREWQNVMVVTSPYHVRRCLHLFQKVGLIVGATAAFSPDDYNLRQLATVIAHEYGAWLKLLIVEVSGRMGIR